MCNEGMRTTSKSVTPLPGGFGFPLGFATGLLLVAGFIATGATDRHNWPLIALALVVAAVSATTTITASLATAVVHWALYASFVVGHQGDLVISPRTAEVAAILTLIAISTATLANRVRTAQSRHSEGKQNRPEQSRPLQRTTETPTERLIRLIDHAISRDSRSTTNGQPSRPARLR